MTESMMRYVYVGVVCLLVAVSGVAWKVPANASVLLPVMRLVAPVNKPLMIIRFNQRKVYYEQQMYNAVARAVSAKPSVVFDIISYIPQGTDHEKNVRVMAKASKHLKSITDSLVKMGVPATRFSVSTKLTPGISYDEIHIFVR